MDQHDGATCLKFRKKLAQVAYARTGAYDAAVSTWMAEAIGETTPRRRVVAGKLAQTLRYGENPHQQAAFYTDGSARPGVATAVQHQGKELSYNNINDTDAAFELVAEFDPADGPAVAIIKHANPCGVARGATLVEAYRKAFDCDRTSAFGGIVALNQPLDVETAEAIAQIFTEVVIAPGASDAAERGLCEQEEPAAAHHRRPARSARRRHDAAPGLGRLAGARTRTTASCRRDDLKVVTKLRADRRRSSTICLFAWKVAKHVKSNAIVYVKDQRDGRRRRRPDEPARFGAVSPRSRPAGMAEALGLAESPAVGSAVASDAFFPFPDGLMEAAAAGATCVIQPGGSMRDDEVIAAADEAGLAMVFTGMRHFRH